MVVFKSAAELATMREAGRVVASTLATVAAAAAPGVSPVDLDRLAADHIAAAGAKPSFLGYQPRWAPVPYPAVLCLSVNDEIVHGIPGRRKLRAGDLLSIDCGAYIDGYHGDAAITVEVGAAEEAGPLDPATGSARRLSADTRRALDAGIAAARPGARIGDISAAIAAIGRAAGYGIPEGLGGHGIGTAMHEDPSVPNSGRAGRGLLLQEGLVIAIEPQFTAGGSDAYRVRPDGWTLVTIDGSLAAHWEHTVAITADGPEVLTVA
jgi:methionyl aminopeptidase